MDGNCGVGLDGGILVGPSPVISEEKALPNLRSRDRSEADRVVEGVRIARRWDGGGRASSAPGLAYMGPKVALNRAKMSSKEAGREILRGVTPS